MASVHVVLVNFCDWALRPPHIENSYAEIQRAIDSAWKSNVKPYKSKKATCERDSGVR